jgi:hypothetical protein
MSLSHLTNVHRLLMIIVVVLPTLAPLMLLLLALLKLREEIWNVAASPDFLELTLWLLTVDLVAFSTKRLLRCLPYVRWHGRKSCVMRVERQRKIVGCAVWWRA